MLASSNDVISKDFCQMMFPLSAPESKYKKVKPPVVSSLINDQINGCLPLFLGSSDGCVPMAPIVGIDKIFSESN